MAIQKELWRPDIIEFLEKDNEFINFCVNADEYVLQGKVVHIPQAGTPANVVRNRATLPATVVKRTDTDITYTLDEYTSDPILLPDADTKQLSYNKRESLIREKMKKMKEFVGDDILYHWAKNIPASNKLPVTGTATHTATGDGATGNRKNMAKADIRKAQTLLNKQNCPKSGRYMLLSDDQLDQLLADLDTHETYSFERGVNLKEGIIGRLYGFDFMTRSTVLQLGADGTVKLQDAATATDDNVAALFWQRDMVERAYGDIDLFEDLGNPQYYGDIYSCITYFGGRARRSDNKGVGALVNIA